MIAPADKKTPPIKVAGYLEKKSKMRMVCRWKKLWFVLEGRLLLYYKSQLEYLSLSPCRGTVNLGLAASVSPGKSNEIIVSTRSNTVSLRALNRSEYDIWLQALMDAMHLPNSNHSVCCTKPVRHFRYSTGGLEEQKDKRCGEFVMNHAHTLSGRLSPGLKRNFNYAERRRPSNAMDLKLDQLSRRFSKIASSDSTIPGNFKTMSNMGLNMDRLKRSVSVEDEVNRYSENIYETVDTKRYRNMDPRRVIRSDSDRLVMRDRTFRPPVFRSEQRIRSIYDLPNLEDHEAFIEMLHKKRMEMRDNRLETPLRSKCSTNSPLDKIKDVKSDTDLTSCTEDEIYHSGSCSALYQTTDSRNISNSNDCYLYSDYLRTDEMYTQPSIPKAFKKPKRSNSILRHFMRPKTDVCSPLMKKQSVKRRSLSFLKKIWRKKEPKFDDDISFNTEIDMQEIHRPNSDYGCSSLYSAVELSLDYGAPLPEPPPDYSHFTDGEDQAPELPPRLTARGPTPWDDPPQNQDTDEPPALPAKKNKNKIKANALDFLLHDGWDPGLKLLFNEPEDYNNQKELIEIMAQLADINAAPLKYTTSQGKKTDEDPDYDIPRPHDSLLLDIKKESSPDTMQPTHFFSHFEDSLDIPHSRDHYDEFAMAPDSLECDPWSLSDSTYEKWTPKSQIRKTIVSSTYGSNREIYFKDTIKLPHNEKNYLNMQNGFIQLHT